MRRRRRCVRWACTCAAESAGARATATASRHTTCTAERPAIADLPLPASSCARTTCAHAHNVHMRTAPAGASPAAHHYAALRAQTNKRTVHHCPGLTAPAPWVVTPALPAPTASSKAAVADGAHRHSRQRRLSTGERARACGREAAVGSHSAAVASAGRYTLDDTVAVVRELQRMCGPRAAACRTARARGRSARAHARVCARPCAPGGARAEHAQVRRAECLPRNRRSGPPHSHHFRTPAPAGLALPRSHPPCCAYAPPEAL